MLTRPSIRNLGQLPPDTAAWKQFVYTAHFSSFLEKIARDKKKNCAQSFMLTTHEEAQKWLVTFAIRSVVSANPSWQSWHSSSNKSGVIQGYIWNARFVQPHAVWVDASKSVLSAITSNYSLRNQMEIHHHYANSDN